MVSGVVWMRRQLNFNFLRGYLFSNYHFYSLMHGHHINCFCSAVVEDSHVSSSPDLPFRIASIYYTLHLLATYYKSADFCSTAFTEIPADVSWHFPTSHHLIFIDLDFDYAWDYVDHRGNFYYSLSVVDVDVNCWPDRLFEATVDSNIYVCLICGKVICLPVIGSDNLFCLLANFDTFMAFKRIYF